MPLTTTPRHVAPSRPALIASLFAILIAAAAAAQTAQVLPPVLSFNGATASVEGVTPNGTVVWFAAIRNVDQYTVAQTSVAQVAAADATGTSTLTVANPISPYSIWVAVDYQTGAYATGSPSRNFPLQLASLPAAALSLDGTGSNPGYLLDAADRIQVLLVRPGAGAWTKTVGRGGPDDESSPADAKLRFRLSRMDPLIAGAAGAAGAPGDDSAPASIGAKDVFFLLHPRTMDVATLPAQVQP